MLKDNFSVVHNKHTLRGEVIRPSTPVGLPAVIICHGIISDMRSTRPYAEYISKLGFAAFIFDFSGGGPHSTSDGLMEEMTINSEISDLNTIIEFVKKQPYVDAEKISLMGLSQGGFVAALVSGSLKGQIHSLLLLYPAFCIPDHARNGSMLAACFDPNNIPATIQCGKMLLGHNYPAEMLSFDAYQLPSEYEGPVLILHGTSDTIVPISYSVNAVEHYKNARLISINGANHGFFNEHDSIAREEIKTFLLNE